MADTPITEFTKLDKSAQETITANAKSQGLTPQEYLASRGGIFKSGYYGDVPEFRRLTDAEYAAASEKGSGSINSALFAKRKAAFQKDPSLIEDPYLRMAFQNGAITIDQLMEGLYPGMVGKRGFGTAATRTPTRQSIGAMADGTPIYGFGSDGKPVTDPNGAIYSTTSSSDAIAKFNSGSKPLGFGSSSTATGATGTADEGYADRKSAYDLLYQQFASYGLGSLVEPLKALITEGVSPSEFTIRLRETDAYKKRFAANSSRINQGLRALSEAEYIQLEDQYQDVMRRYGMPASYYARGDMGIQQGFEKFIAGDVSATELEDRIQTAYNRVINAAPEVAQTLRTFYPEISDGDILAYALDPSNAIENIKRKVTAAEIGGAATSAGFTTGLNRAEELLRYGVTGAAAREGYQSIGTFLPRTSTLSDIYAKQGLGEFTQATAESEVFGTPGSVEAAQKRRKLAGLEQAQFGGSAGTTTGALGRERAGQF